MSQPYVGECRMGGWNFAPAGWAFCQGQLLPISENETLFNLIGTTYGGDGQSTFQLPDLRGRVPIHQGTGPGGVGFTVAQLAGFENVTLTVAQLASHSHPLIASSSNGNTNLLQNQVLAGNATQVYRVTSPSVSAPMNGNTIRPDGGNQPHNNLQPYMVLNWVISLFGVFPTPG